MTPTAGAGGWRLEIQEVLELSTVWTTGWLCSSDKLWELDHEGVATALGSGLDAMGGAPRPALALPWPFLGCGRTEKVLD